MLHGISKKILLLCFLCVSFLVPPTYSALAENSGDSLEDIVFGNDGANGIIQGGVYNPQTKQFDNVTYTRTANPNINEYRKAGSNDFYVIQKDSVSGKNEISHVINGSNFKVTQQNTSESLREQETGSGNLFSSNEKRNTSVLNEAAKKPNYKNLPDMMWVADPSTTNSTGLYVHKNKDGYYTDIAGKVMYEFEQPAPNTHPDVWYITSKTEVGSNKPPEKVVPREQQIVDELEEKTAAIEAALQAQLDAEKAIACPEGINKISVDMILCGLAKLAYFGILSPLNSLFGIVSSMFDSVIDLAVVNMSQTLGLCRSTEAGCTNVDNNIINIGWKTFRDLANMLFIFVLVYAAIRTILFGTSDTGKTISTVIVVAVLINFSMFFTKVVIDISNTLSISFYESIKNYKAPGQTVANKDKSVLAPLIDKTQIMSIVGVTQNKENRLPLTYLSIIKQSLLGSVFVIILTGIILIMTLMLLGRVIILGFVIMTSALAVGSYIWPSLKSSIADKWLPALIGQSFFAPVFLLLLYISLVFVSQFGSTEALKGGDLSNILDVTGSATQAIIQYTLVIGMLIMSLKIAKDMASKAGSGAGKITAALGGLALGGAALGGRLLGGGVAGNLLNKFAGDRNTMGARMMRTVGNKLQTSSYDMRNLKSFENLSDGVAGKGGGEGGFEKGWEKFRESTIPAWVAPNEKGQKAQIAEHEKNLKERSKFTDAERLATLRGSQVENDKELGDAIEVDKLGTRLEAQEKRHSEISSKTIRTPEENAEREELARKIEETRRSIAKKDITVADARKKLDEKNYAGTGNSARELLEAKKMAKKTSDARKKAYVDQVRKTARWWSGDDEFVMQQAEKDAKKKNDNDDVVSELKELKSKIK